ncbi:hypothetical protein G6F40_017033 [Rhizopus arrhizus]|nr:hypothetical protein G6F40_017033 [Rhizopus arrhizus]
MGLSHQLTAIGGHVGETVIDNGGYRLQALALQPDGQIVTATAGAPGELELRTDLRPCLDHSADRCPGAVLLGRGERRR